MKKLQSHNRRIYLYILLLTVVVALMYMLKTCSSANPHNPTIHPSAGDSIDVAIEYSPLSLYYYNDTLGGFSYDMIRLISLKHNRPIKFHPIVSLSNAINNLNNGIFDLLIAQLPITSNYNEQYLYTEPVYLDRQVLVQKKDSITGKARIKSQIDLAGETVWVVANSPLINRISNLSTEIGDTIYINEDSLYSSEQLIIMTATGDISQAVVNERIAKAMLHDYPMIDISTNISFTQFQSWLVNKNDSLLCDSLNSWIKEFKDSPDYQKLQSKYFK